MKDQLSKSSKGTDCRVLPTFRIEMTLFQDLLKIFKYLKVKQKDPKVTTKDNHEYFKPLLLHEHYI